MRKRDTAARVTALSALFCAIIVICSLICIPVFAIPITFQLFGIYAALYILGGKLGTVCVVVYVALGAIGLPVFSGFSGGIGRLFDATGGFIIGFILLSLVYWIIRRYTDKLKHSVLIATVASLSVLYIVGALWYCFVYLGDISRIGAALLATVLPFIPFDVLKILLALTVSTRILSKTNLHILK